MYNIVYSEKLKNDFISIREFISLDNPVYAVKTINSILKTIDILGDFPYIGKNIGSNLREIVENTYKYKIIYTIVADTITIISVYKYKNNWC
ncbi:MAG: type II toxin-antitoxin system RelE/ParE family toxin [Candidatus Gracilibacteria bacterium]|nr:type II toxin-antitoxin system RelE/ParE family toxin [Candidatus Gracilibacteria bacterium]